MTEAVEDCDTSIEVRVTLGRLFRICIETTVTEMVHIYGVYWSYIPANLLIDELLFFCGNWHAQKGF